MRFAFTLLSALLFSFSYAQNVGIGITTPAVPLHIKNNGSELLRLQGNDPYLTFFDNSGVVKGFVLNHGNNLNLGTTTGNTTGLVQFYTHNNLSMVLHPNSNIGIGTAEPSFRLTVQTSGSDWGIVHRNADVIVGTWVGVNSGMNGGWYGTYTNHALNFFTNNGGPQITLLQTGNVGIGTINPVAKLHIAADGEALRLSGTNPYFTMYNGAALKGYLWSKGANDIELGTDDGNPNGNLSLSIREIPQLILQSDGRVRVGPVESTFSIPVGGYDKPNFTVGGVFAIKMPAAPLDEWAIAATLGFSGDGALSFFKNGTSRSFIGDNGDWHSLSDASLKENVKIFRPVLSQIGKLQVSTYQFKWNHNSNVSFGLIAQNVNEYFPEIVSENIDKDGKRLLAISYAKTGVLAIKAIQEQQEIIESMQKKIDELEKVLAILKDKLK